MLALLYPYVSLMLAQLSPHPLMLALLALLSLYLNLMLDLIVPYVRLIIHLC